MRSVLKLYSFTNLSVDFFIGAEGSANIAQILSGIDQSLRKRVSSEKGHVGVEMASKHCHCHGAHVIRASFPMTMNVGERDKAVTNVCCLKKLKNF